MGMDVSGKNDAYFRASVWSWVPICAVMAAAGFDVPESWGFNHGAGLDSEEECNALATMIRKYLNQEENVNEQKFIMESDFRLNGENPYWTTREHLNEWCAFLNNCGDGFEIF